mgnify:CR=1 FL=1
MVVRDKQIEISIVVMNNSDTPVKLYSGTKNSKLSAVLVKEDNETILRPSKGKNVNILVSRSNRK